MWCVYIYIYTHLYVSYMTTLCISIWRLAVILVLVPTLCRAGGVGTRCYKIEFGTRLPGTRSICIVLLLVYEIWHKVMFAIPAQGYVLLVFHDVAQGPHKVNIGRVVPEAIVGKPFFLSVL